MSHVSFQLQPGLAVQAEAGYTSISVVTVRGLGDLALTANTMGLIVKYPETLELGDKRDRRLSCDLRASYTFRVTHWLEGCQPSGNTPVSQNMSKVSSVFKGHHNLGTSCRD